MGQFQTKRLAVNAVNDRFGVPEAETQNLCQNPLILTVCCVSDNWRSSCLYAVQQLSDSNYDKVDVIFNTADLSKYNFDEYDLMLMDKSTGGRPAYSVTIVVVSIGLQY